MSILGLEEKRKKEKITLMWFNREYFENQGLKYTPIKIFLKSDLSHN